MRAKCACPVRRAPSRTIRARGRGSGARGLAPARRSRWALMPLRSTSWIGAELPGPAQRMRFGVEHDLVEIESAGRAQQPDVLERLGEEEAGHQVALLTGGHVVEHGVAGLGAAACLDV